MVKSDTLKFCMQLLFSISTVNLIVDMSLTSASRAANMVVTDLSSVMMGQ